jgi:hypothetical protein
VNGPEVWWEGVSHKQIIDWINAGPGTNGMDALAERLTKLAETLNRIADLKNTVLQRINSGEWSGSAAEVAAQAVQMMRDFDDTMVHRSLMNTLAIHGQADNAAWAKANVPPLVDTHAAQVPTGNLIDVLNSTVDHQQHLRAVKEAEEQARRVMREYEAMTVDRIAAQGPPVPTPGAGRDPVGREPDGSTPAGTDLSRTEPSGTAGGHSFASSPVGVVAEAPRTAGSPVGGIIGGPGGEGPPHGGRPGGEPRVGERGSQSGTGLRGGTTEMVGRGGPRGNSTGVAPFGTATRGNPDDDKEHQVKYALTGAEIFEPDNDDGLLHDPFRPGSFVAPASIGDDDDE